MVKWLNQIFNLKIYVEIFKLYLVKIWVMVLRFISKLRETDISETQGWFKTRDKTSLYLVHQQLAFKQAVWSSPLDALRRNYHNKPIKYDQETKNLAFKQNL